MTYLDELLAENYLTFQDLKKLELASSKLAYEFYLLPKTSNLIIIRRAKSRFISKNLLAFQKLYKEVLENFKLSPEKKYFFSTSPLCSKSKKILQNKGFEIYDFM